MTNIDRIARIRIELDDLDPLIWRSVEVPLTMSLKGLHEVIQAVMLFENYHLFQFDADGKRYGIPDPEWDDGRKILDARKVKLGTLVDRGVDRFSYTYDFGDNWQHTITVETITAADLSLDYPRFIDGARRAPPEDVGGIPCFQAFLEAMAKPRHPERKRLVTWYGRLFDPNDIDPTNITARIGQLARRRALGKAAYAKRQTSTH
jgi:hypothetical protein